MTTRLKLNMIKALFIFGLFTLMLLTSLISNGQVRENTYKGFDVNFGIRTYHIDSDIAEISGSNVQQAGGQIGFVYGNEIFRSKVGAGYYSSTANVAGTIDLYQANASVNFYPLALGFWESPRLAPYVTGGMSFDNFKFRGYYLNTDPGPVNYSASSAPYLGATGQINATIGLGLEFKILDDYDFVHLFSEVVYGHNMISGSKDAAFDNTHLNHQIQANIGISFGMHR